MIQNGLKDLTVTGTCFEYGMLNGCLNEEMEVEPANPYAIAKNRLWKYLELLSLDLPFSLKWVRLFYMYGEGQNPKSLFSQLDKAIEENHKIFNMSEISQAHEYMEKNENIGKIIIKNDL